MARSLFPWDVSLDMGEVGTLSVEPALSERGRALLRDELRETEDNVEPALAELRSLLEEEKDLRVPTDDDFLKAVLRPCHWYPESAYMKLKKYYEFKLKNPQISKDLLPSRLENSWRAGVVWILPRRDQHGRRILLLRTGGPWDPKKVSVDDLMRSSVMWLEVALTEPDTQAAGAILLWDLDGLTLSQVLRFTPSFARMLLHFIQDCLPLRLKAVHFVRQSNLFDIAFKVFKPFIRDKLRNRMFFHGKDFKSLLEYIDPKVLPRDYGGLLQMREFPGEEFVQLSARFERYFEEMGKFGYQTGKQS